MTKQVFHVNLAQIRSAIPETFHIWFTKKQKTVTDSAKTDP